MFRKANILSGEYSEVNKYQLQLNLSKFNGSYIILESKLNYLAMYLETEFHGGSGAKVFLLPQT